jgi:glutathione S-transferase
MTGKLGNRSAELLAAKRSLSEKTLRLLDRWLIDRDFLVEGAYTIADMSVFAYVSRADEAGLPLEAHPALARWVARVRAQPGFLETVHPYSIDPHSALELH